MSLPQKWGLVKPQFAVRREESPHTPIPLSDTGPLSELYQTCTAERPWQHTTLRCGGSAARARDRTAPHPRPAASGRAGAVPLWPSRLLSGLGGRGGRPLSGVSRRRGLCLSDLPVGTAAERAKSLFFQVALFQAQWSAWPVSVQTGRGSRRERRARKSSAEAQRAGGGGRLVKPFLSGAVGTRFSVSWERGKVGSGPA